MRVKARYEERDDFAEGELEKATPTLIGRPVTVMFGNQVVGTVIDAVYTDGGIDLDLDFHDLGVAGFREGKGIIFTELSLVKEKESVSIEEAS